MSVDSSARRSRTVARSFRLFVPLAIVCAALLLGALPAAASGPLPPNITSVAFSPQDPRIGQDIFFSAVAVAGNGGSIAGYAWDFNDDGVTDSTQQTPTLTNGFATGGDHKVTVTVTTNELDSTHLTAKSSLLVHVHTANLPPNVNNVVADPEAPRVGTDVQLFSTAQDPDGDSGSLTYDWNFGDGTAHSTEKQPVHAWSTGGNYIVTLVVGDADGGSATQSLAVKVHASNQPPNIIDVGSDDPNPGPDQRRLHERRRP